MKTTELPISPSKTLLRFSKEIASFGKGLILDAPCGYGRNAVALAALGARVVAVDNDRRPLSILERTKTAYVAASTPPIVTSGKIFPICADLNAKLWPFEPSTFSAVVCIHFPIVTLVPCFLSALERGGHIYIETFGGHGENFRHLPKAGQLKKVLLNDVEFKYYKERKVGPTEFDTVAVTLLAQKRRNVRIPGESPAWIS